MPFCIICIGIILYLKCGNFKASFFIIYTNHLPQPPAKCIGKNGICQEVYFFYFSWRLTSATILLYTPNMKNINYEPKDYIDIAYLQCQLVGLLEIRNQLQKEINKKEEELKKLKND